MEKKTASGDIQAHCAVFSSQQKLKDCMETKYAQGCLLCNQLKVRVSGGFDGSVRDRRARRKTGMLFCFRNRPFLFSLLVPTEYMPTSDLLPLTPESGRESETETATDLKSS